MNFYSKIKTLAKRLFLVSFAFIALSFILNAVADNPYTQKLARSIVNQSFSQYSNLNISFEAVKIDILPLGVELFGFSIFPVEDSSVSIRASQIKARVSLWSLVLGDPRLSSIEISDLESTHPFPDVISKMFPDETSDTEPFTWPPDLSAVPVDSISLRHARLYLELPNPDSKDTELKLLKLALGDLNATADISDPDEIKVNIEINSLSLKSLEFNILDSAAVQASLTLGAHGIQPSTIKVKSPHLDLNSVITGDLIKDPVNAIQNIKIEGSATGDAKLEMLGSVLDIEDTYGPVTTRSKFSFNIPIVELDSSSKPTFSIITHVTSKGGVIGGFKLFESEADLDINTEKIIFKNTKIIKDKIQYGEADGFLTLDKKTKFKFDAKTQKLPLTTLLSAVKVDFDGIESAISTPRLIIEGQGTPLQMRVSSLADFNFFEVNTIDIAKNSQLPTHCRLNVNLDINVDRLSFNGTDGQCYSSHQPTDPIQIKTDNNKPSNLILGSSPLKLDGWASFDEKTGMKLKVMSTAFALPIAGYIFQLPLKGTSNTELNISGPYNDISLSGSIHSDSLLFSSINFGRLDGSYVLDSKNNLTLKQLRILTPKNGSIYVKSGSINLDEHLTFESEIEVSAINKELIASVTDYLGYPEVKFDIDNISGKLSGPLKKPFNYLGNLSLSVSNIFHNKDLLFDNIASEFEADKSEINGKKLNLSIREFSLHNNFKITKSNKNFSQASDLTSLGFNPNNTLVITSKTEDPNKGKENTDQGTFSTDYLQQLPILKKYFKQANLEGRLSVESKLQGKLDNLEGRAEISILNARLFGSPVAPINTVTIIEDKKIDVIANHSGRSLEGRFKLDLNDTKIPYSWYITAKRLDLRALGSKLFADDPRNYAYVTGNWSMQGTFDDWWSSKGSLNINDIRLRFMRDIRGRSNIIELMHTKPINLSFSEKGWHTIDGKDIKLLGEKIALNISTRGNRPPDRLNIQFDGQLDLSVLQSINTHIESAEGIMSFTGNLKGSIDDPKFTLKLQDKKQDAESKDWIPVSIGISDIRPPLTKVNFDINYVNNSLTLNSFTADKGEGSVNANGALYFDQRQSSRIDIAFKNASFVYQSPILKSFDTEASGNISIVGSQKPYLISGEIQIDRARSTRQFDLREHIIAALQRKHIENNANVIAPVANFDLRVSANNSIEIYNRNIQAKLSANMTLSGTNTSPIITGQVEVDRGAFAYKYRRDFQVTQGIITFDDPTRPDPRLDILGMSEINGYRVYMAITGRASDPKVDLSADPPTREDGTPLTKVDILVLMATGSLPDRQRSDSITQDAAKTEALNILVGQFEEPVEKLFDLSGQSVIRQVYIDTYADPQGTPTPRLNLPLNLHQDWDVIFRVDSQNNLKVSLGYSVNNHISLSGSFDKQQESEAQNQSSSNPTDTGVDLKFRFAFP